MEIVAKKKVIWLVNKHAAPIQYNATNLRTYKLAYYLSQSGYEVRIICSGYIHNRNINLMQTSDLFEEQEHDGVKFTFIRTMQYTTNSVKRIMSILQFAINVFRVKNRIIRPDIILHTAGLPFEFLIQKCADRLKAKYIVEIVDLWPESFVAFGLIGKKNPLLIIMYGIENYIYKKADKLIFSMEGGIAYLKDKKWDIESGGKINLNKVYYLNNGVDIADFDRNKLKYVLDDCHLSNDSIKKIIYLGSIRLANNLKSFIDAAACLQSRKDIIFLIYGDGDDRIALEEYIEERGITNVIFKQKWISLEYVPYVLSKAYLNVINYKPNDIERYGGSQNKLFQAMASGKPICSNVGMAYSVIDKYCIGIDRRFETAREYADSLQMLIDLDDTSYTEMCERAKKAALNFDLKSLANIYKEKILIN